MGQFVHKIVTSVYSHLPSFTIIYHHLPSFTIIYHHLAAIFCASPGPQGGTIHGGRRMRRQVASHVAPLLREVIAQLVIERPGLGIQAKFTANSKWPVIGKDGSYLKSMTFDDF